MEQQQREDREEELSYRPSFSWKIIPMAGVTVLIFYVLIKKLSGWEAISQVFLQADWEIMPFICLLVLFNLGLAGIRIIILTRALGISKQMG